MFLGVSSSKAYNIQGLGQLTKLRTWKIDFCKEIQELSGVEHLMSLEELYIRTCPKLQRGVGILEQLRQQFNKNLKEHSKSSSV
jgi:hypothetical protein